MKCESLIVIPVGATFVKSNVPLRSVGVNGKGCGIGVVHSAFENGLLIVVESENGWIANGGAVRNCNVVSEITVSKYTPNPDRKLNRPVPRTSHANPTLGPK